jgi:hypothetical protein
LSLGFEHLADRQPRQQCLLDLPAESPDSPVSLPAHPAFLDLMDQPRFRVI